MRAAVSGKSLQRGGVASLKYFFPAKVESKIRWELQDLIFYFNKLHTVVEE
jgi:hypothetical protein